MAGEGGATAAATVCGGAPREAGFGQGAAFRATLRRRFRTAPAWTRLRHRLGWSGPDAAAAARDLRRHFPHQAEALSGIARGSGVPQSWLERLLVEQLVAGPAGVADSAAARAAGRGPTASFLALRVGADAVVRRSRPEGRFRSIDVTLPWYSASLAGVNEAGLAAVCVPRAGASGRCRAPAALLVQDCLQRFESIEAALDWCAGRPAGGRATLLLGDARGDVAGLEMAGDERRALRPGDGLLVACARRGGESEIAKSLRDDTPSDLAALERALGGGSEPGGVVLADPVDRRLGLLRRGAAAGPSVVAWFPV